jgi:hypothetical protein
LPFGGCSTPPSGEEAHHPGPKINIPDFIKNTAAYKGKSISLDLKVDEAIVPATGQSLRDYVGRDVKFRTVSPKGEVLNLVISIPAGLDVPDVGPSEEVSVRFVCTRGSLRQGNQAQSIERL